MKGVEGNQVMSTEKPHKLLRISLWSFTFFQGTPCMPWSREELRVKVAEDDHCVPGGSRAEGSRK